jgi:HPt (histidine-containing phosphotransfer) domain-containing protein
MHKLYDTKNLSDTHQGDTQFIKHIAALFVQHMPVMTGELKKAFVNKDWQSLYFYAHKMKASIDLFGLKELAATIRTIEQQGKTGIPADSLGKDVHDVESIITECAQQLKHEFGISAEQEY